MNRDFKFRAWDEQKKIMHYDFEFIRSGTEGNDWIVFKSDRQRIEDGNVLNNPYFQLQLKIMQFTGLKDKNGKEIYEGDITNYGEVEYRTDLNWDSGGSPHPGFYFKAQWGEPGNLEYHYGFDDDIEVIGNIFENPELLNPSSVSPS